MSRYPLVLLGIAILAMFDFSLYSSELALNLFLSWPGSRKQEVRAPTIDVQV